MAEKAVQADKLVAELEKEVQKANEKSGEAWQRG